MGRVYDLTNVPDASQIIGTNYVILSNGSVVGIRKEFLKPNLTPRGYEKVSLMVGNKKITSYPHILVAKAFIKNDNMLNVINHINGIKTDNRVENLEWCTSSRNTKHAYEIGLIKPLRGVSRADNKSGFVGVSKNEGLWMATININGKNKNLGRFKCRLASAYAYDLASIKHYGNSGKRNFLNKDI